ncbi:MAG TPA: hypothetical protein DD473_28005 [Planctomycetaceae bacterium]|nr:hypothetical protein [Planctomycetaceae bacterium]
MMRSKRFLYGCFAAITAMSLASVGQAFEKQAQNALVPTSKIVGGYIYNAGDEHIASVDDIVMNSQGEVQYLIVGVGGLAGLGQSQVAIPSKAVKCECTTKDGERECRMTLSMTQEKLNQAPKLEQENRAELMDNNWVTRNRSHFSVDSPLNDKPAGKLISYSNVNDVTVQTGNNDETTNGQLDDLIVDTADHKVKFAIIGIGGALGVGESYVAVPFNALQLTENEDQDYTISTKVTSKQLKSAPKVTSPDYSELESQEFRTMVNKMKNAKKQ